MNTSNFRIPVPLTERDACALADRIESRGGNRSAGNEETAFLKEQAAALRLYERDRREGEKIPLRPRATTIPKVSVIMPVWNRAHVLERAVRSVLAQTHANWECLIVDDGSTDGSLEIGQSMAGEDQRIRSISQTHQGAARARNRGLDEATGEIVAYLDSDNRYYPDYLEAIAAAYLDSDTLDCAYAAMVTTDAGPDDELLYREIREDLRLQRNVTDLNVFSHRRLVAERVGGFDERLRRLQDWDLIHRYTLFAPPHRIPVIGAEYSDRGLDRISRRESCGIAYTRFLQKHRKPLIEVQGSSTSLPEVLCIHRKESTWIDHEASAATRAGFRVKSVQERSDLDAESHLRREREGFSPFVIHLQGEAVVHRYYQEALSSGIPVTIRIDDPPPRPSFIFQSDQDYSGAARFEVFFHHLQVDSSSPSKAIEICRPGIDPEIFFPRDLDGDRELVITSLVEAASSPTFLEALFEARRKAPQVPFALLVPQAFQAHPVLQSIQARESEWDLAPMEIFADLGGVDRADRMRRAAFYLAAPSAGARQGYPFLSRVEAAACGCLPLELDLDGRRQGVSEVPAYFLGKWVPEFGEIMAKGQFCGESAWRQQVNRCLEIVFPFLTAMESSLALFGSWRELYFDRVSRD